jgi:hypothetical protein
MFGFFDHTCGVKALGCEGCAPGARERGGSVLRGWSD